MTVSHLASEKMSVVAADVERIVRDEDASVFLPEEIAETICNVIFPHNLKTADGVVVDYESLCCALISWMTNATKKYKQNRECVAAYVIGAIESSFTVD